MAFEMASHSSRNVGNPSEFTVRQLAELVIKMTKSKSRIEVRPLPQDDPKRRCPDITKAKRILKWEPKVNLEEGLELTIAYFREAYAKSAAR